MTTPKAFFFDLDGTLLSGGKMPQSAKDALVYARNKGVKLFIATGRRKEEIGELASSPDFTFDGIVSMNGTYAYIGDRVVYKSAIHRDDVKFAIECLAKNPQSCMFCEAEDMYVNLIDQRAKEMHERLVLPTPRVVDITRALEAEIFQMVIFSDEIKDAFQQGFKHSLFTSWAKGCYDIVPTGVNKWVGIQHMIDEFGLKPNEIATFGDGDNDLEMIREAGFSVAMGNAVDEVKKHAKHVTAHADDDGILKAVKFILG